jgi:hypothetical protein
MESSVAPDSRVDDDRLVVEPLDPVKARRVIWVVLVILAGLQAWAARFTATPDGISYVDLSDAIVNGHLGEIVNAYWSPLYPALLGVLRLAFRPGPYWEFALVHLLNVLLFAASIAGFEYFLSALTAAAGRWGRGELETIPGKIIAYAVFGALSLMMTPLSLPTPDLLVTTASFLVFGGLLRLRDEPNRRRHAVVLGLALAMGSLAKSFFIPWSAVVFITAWAATRRSGWRPTATAAAAWLLFVGPWCAVLSAHQGRLTFGDTGRLTYIWNVNQVESPSMKVMPHGSTTAASDSALRGVAVTPNARGTNPVWFDPARWYTDLSPEWNPSKQLAMFSGLVSQFFSTMAPVLLVIWFACAVATRDDRAEWWGRVWIVMLPALVAMGTYSMVLITTRYIAPFVIALTLAVCFAMRWPSRLAPGRVLLGLGVPLLIIMATPGDALVLSFMNSALASVLFAWSFRRRGPMVMIVTAVLGSLSVWMLLPRNLRSFVMIGAVLIFALYWIASRRAIANHEARRFSRVVRQGLFITNGLIIGIVGALKYKSSVAPLPVITGEPNLNWLQAEAMRQAGVVPGMRIAIVGSPFEAYWARTGRLQIVGVVPPWRVAAFRTLPADKREMLFREFARAGARAVVSLTPTAPVAGDTSWVPHDYIGWIKRLPGR